MHLRKRKRANWPFILEGLVILLILKELSKLLGM